MNPTSDRKALLSTLWIFVIFNYLYADLMIMIVTPDTYVKAAARMTGGTVLGFTVLMEVLIAMPLVARVLPYRSNRWTNIFGGLLGTVFVAATLAGRTPAYYLFLASLEIACTLFIVWYAWTWRAPETS